MNRFSDVRKSYFPKGMTLTELLMSITVVGMLLGLILPAVAAARRSGGKVNCENNLRQLGLAIARHVNDTQYFPVDGENGFGSLVFLLPYFEQDTLYKSLQPLKRHRSSLATGDAGQTYVDNFACLSAGGGKWTPSDLARASYLGTVELFSSKVRIADIRDGTSETIAMGETLADHAWILPGRAPALPPGEGLFDSDHTGGTFFVFCDGSVRQIDGDVDPNVFHAWCAIAENDQRK